MVKETGEKSRARERRRDNKRKRVRVSRGEVVQGVVREMQNECRQIKTVRVGKDERNVE